MLNGKTIILGVTGCIAAYKSVELLRELKKLGAEVWVAMTEEATKLVGPLTFRTLSGNPVITDLFSDDLSKLPVPHISLTERADLVLVAPATANILAKAAGGIADDPLTTMVLAAKCPVVFAPAMNTNMWNNEATRGNVAKLRKTGHGFVGPEAGPLACGESGIGRFSPVGKIVGEVKSILVPRQDLRGLRITVTAGPTRESIDPVRFISNRSTGKMGYALAEAAAKRGADVTLISGPTSLRPVPNVEFIAVETAGEMAEAVNSRFESSDVVIMSAAVSDFAPRAYRKQKIKKGAGELSIDLERTADILKEMGKKKGKRILAGFSLETENLNENSRKKLEEKNLDLIIANDASGLGSDTNRVTVMQRDGKVDKLPEMRKIDLADRILDYFPKHELRNRPSITLSRLSR